MTENKYDYMHCPKESFETIQKFVAHGNANGGELSFVREELAELIRAVERYERTFYAENADPPYEYACSVKDNLVEEIAHVYLVLNHLRYTTYTPLQFIRDKMDIKIHEYGFETYEEGKRNG